MATRYTINVAVQRDGNPAGTIAFGLWDHAADAEAWAENEVTAEWKLVPLHDIGDDEITGIRLHLAGDRGPACGTTEPNALTTGDDDLVTCSECREEIPVQPPEAIAEAVKQVKKEILADLKEGVLNSSGLAMPYRVSSFSELHDYVDANVYGGFCDDNSRSTWNVADINRVQTLIDEWLKMGGHRQAAGLPYSVCVDCGMVIDWDGRRWEWLSRPANSHPAACPEGTVPLHQPLWLTLGELRDRTAHLPDTFPVTLAPAGDIEGLRSDWFNVSIDDVPFHEEELAETSSVILNIHDNFDTRQW